MSERSHEGSASVQNQNWTSVSASEQLQVVSPIPETVDDFLRNFLLRLGLNRTLDCFQREWYQNQRQSTFIPDALTQQSFVQSELCQARQEAELLQRQVMDLNETLMRLQRERDFHREQFEQLLKQKNELLDDFKRLKEHHDGYEPALKTLAQKYDAALRLRTLVGLETERVRKETGRNTTRGSDKSEEKSSIKQSQRETAALNVSNNVGAPSCLTLNNNVTEMAAENRSNKRGDILDLIEYENKKANGQTRMRVTSVEKNVTNIKSSAERNGAEEVKQELGKETSPASFSLFCSIRAHHQPISCIELHPIKRLLASTADDRTWKLWALPANQEKVGELLLTGEGHSDWLTSCSFSHEGDKLATTSGDSTVRVWDLLRGLCVLTLSDHLSSTWGCSFHHFGLCLASASSDRTIRLWDLETGRSRSTLRCHGSAVSSVHFLPQSDHFLLSSSKDKTLVLWDTRANVGLTAFSGHRFPCNYATSNWTGDTMASCDSGGVVKLWDVRRPNMALVSVETGPSGANQVSFSPTGGELAVAGGDGQVRLLQVNGGETNTLRHDRGGRQVNSVRFDHQGETLMSAGHDGTIQFWNRNQRND